MTLPRTRPWPLLASLAALLCLQPAGPAPLRAVAIAVAWGLAPGLLLSSRLAGAPAALRVLLGVGWSPFLAGGVTSLLAALGMSVGAAASAVTLGIALWAFVEALLPPPAQGRGVAPREPSAGIPHAAALAPWIVGLGGGLLVLGFHLARPMLAQRSDGSFHAAVTLAVLRTGVPPEDPFFAGLRLLYFWGTHVWSAAWLALAPGLAASTPLVALMVGATFVALAGVALLAQRLGAGASTTVLAGALAMFGTAPFSWLWIVARMASGEVRGLAEARRLLGRGVDPALTVLGTGLLHPSLVLPADKFIVVTPFALGIGLAVALVLLMLELVARPARRTAVALALTAAAALFVHPVAGAAILAAGSLAWMMVLDRAVAGEPRAGRAAAESAAAVLAAFAIAVPYLLVIESSPYDPGPTGGAPALGARALWSVLFGGALILTVGGWWLVRRCPRAGERRVLLGTSAILGTGVLFFEMRGDNQSKLLNLLFFLMSPAAAMGWREIHRRARPALRPLVPALLLVATVPTLLCCAWAYGGEGSGSADAPQDPGPRGRTLLAEVSRRASPAAVVVDGTLDTLVRVASPDPRLAGRPLLWGGWYMAGKWGYPRSELAARAQAATELGSGSGAARTADSLLRALGREAWVLRRIAPAPDSASSRWHEVRREDGLTLYRFSPGAR